ncbi:unnamed protein product [Protopolystoma xenopodis]|uniref:Uncharacterized protein n=1 Tax=Protopolystoma xenopodis TaxID=117903 RepID=A0A448XHB7_9PLAT|nr:unnamed protein product [Protopolystoma xenopodis]
MKQYRYLSPFCFQGSTSTSHSFITPLAAASSFSETLAPSLQHSSVPLSPSPSISYLVNPTCQSGSANLISKDNKQSENGPAGDQKPVYRQQVSVGATPCTDMECTEGS